MISVRRFAAGKLVCCSICRKRVQLPRVAYATKVSANTWCLPLTLPCGHVYVIDEAPAAA